MSSTVTLTQTIPFGAPTDIDHVMTEVDEQEESLERETKTINYQNCSKGLGIKIIGGCSLDGEEDYGIFVKRVLPGGLAEIEGQLRSSDQLLEVNGDSLEGVTNERAVAILRKASASNVVEIVISRDAQAREEYDEVLDRQNFSSHNCTPVPTETPSRASSKASSRSTTPSFTDVKVSPRYDSLYQTPMQHNGLEENHAKAPTPLGELSHAERDTTPAINRFSHTDRFGTRLQPNMSSTPQGVRSKAVLSNQSSNQSVFTGSHNISPVVASPGTMFPTGELPKSQDMSQTRKLSLDPHVRLRVERLEDALRYLGLDPSSEQQALLRNNLHVDASGTVSYGEFVKEAREIFRFQLDEQNLGPGAMLFAAQDLTSLLEPPPFKPELSTIPDVVMNEDFESVKRERDELQAEVSRLKELLREKEESCSVAEDEILHIRRQAQGAIHETRSLRSKVHLAEQAQRAARNMEQDYEEVVRLLEKEIAEMKVELGKKQESPGAEMEKRLAVVSCQLRKTESAKKTYEVSTEKLLQFVEHVHETLKHEENDGKRRMDVPVGEASRGPRQSGPLGKHKQSAGAHRLATEAREVIKAIKSLTDSQDLPYGWEEAYTEDGMRYYINHFSQMTTWSHPVSNVHHLPTIQGAELRDQRSSAPGYRTEVKHQQPSTSGQNSEMKGQGPAVKDQKTSGLGQRSDGKIQR